MAQAVKPDACNDGLLMDSTKAVNALKAKNPQITFESKQVHFVCSTNKEEYLFIRKASSATEPLAPSNLLIEDPSGEPHPTQVFVHEKPDNHGFHVFKVVFKGIEETGQWKIIIQNNSSTLASGSFPYQAVKPVLLMVGQKKKENGKFDFLFRGFGFSKELEGKKISFKYFNPGGVTQKPLEVLQVPILKNGKTQRVSVPFVANPTPGTYSFTLEFDPSPGLQTGDLLVEIVCEANAKCQANNSIKLDNQ